MHKYLLLVFVCCYCLTSKSQTFCDRLITLLNNNQLFSEIKKIPAFQWKEIHDPYLKEDFTDAEFGFKISYGGFESDNSTSINQNEKIVLTIYTRNDTIMAAFIDTINSRVVLYERRNAYVKIDTNINQLLRQHNAKYFSSWTITDLLNPPKLPGVFGLNWGSKDNSETHALSELIKNKNHHALFQLASSLDPSFRAVGTVGLYALKLEGEKLSKEEDALISINRSSNLKVEIQVGHSHYTGQETMSKFLSEELILWYISNIKTY